MSMLKAVWDAIKRLFAGMPQEACDSVSVAPDTEHPDDHGDKEVTAPQDGRKKARKQRSAPPRELISMGDLLGSLDEMFSALRLPFGKLSWIPRAKVVGLRKMGVHVVHPAYHDAALLNVSTVPANRILPAMLCVSFGWSRRDNSEHVFPVVLFAMKENKLPAEVSKCAGQHYLFGAGFKLGAASENDASKELFWLSGYMTVRSDGSLCLHQELKPRQHTINVSNPATRRAIGKTATFTRKEWGKASLAQLYDECANGEWVGKGERACINEFAAAMNWWIAREANWNVAVKKDGERITFSIPKELTARFFKDRIKVTNENGATKKIIHYVNAHERATAEGKTSVKEHIRGLAEFDWKGYGCRVTAPRFNGVLSTEFTLCGTVVEDDEEVSKKGWVDMSKIGAILADVEEGRKRA